MKHKISINNLIKKIMAHSAGKWIAKGTDKNQVTWVEAGGKRICTMKLSESDWDNASLIANAGTTANETGLLPSEIWAERKLFAARSIKLLDALKAAQELLKKRCLDTDREMLDLDLGSIIANAEE